MNIQQTFNTGNNNDITDEIEQKKSNSGRNIAECLPNEILNEIFSKLDMYDLRNCKQMCKRFLSIIDEHSLEKIFFCRSLNISKAHPMFSANYYKSITRSWLQKINMPDGIIQYLDENIQNSNFSVKLFFELTKDISAKKNITYENTTTLTHSTGLQIGYNQCTIACYLGITADIIVTLSCNNGAKIWRLLDNNWLLEDTLNNYSENREIACINDIHLSPNGCFIVTVSNFEFKIWDYSAGNWQEHSSFKNLYADKFYFRDDSKRFIITGSNLIICDLIDNKWKQVTTDVVDTTMLDTIDPDISGSTMPYIKHNILEDNWLKLRLQNYIISRSAGYYRFTAFGDRIMTLIHSAGWKTWSSPKYEPSGINYTFTSPDMKLFMMSGCSGYRGGFTIIFELIDNKWEKKIISTGITRWAFFSPNNKKVILYQEHFIENNNNKAIFSKRKTQIKAIVYNITDDNLIETLDLGSVNKTIFSADAMYIAASINSTVQIWQKRIKNEKSSEQQLTPATKTWQLITSIDNENYVEDISFSLDKRLLTIMSCNGEVRIYTLY